MSKRNFEIHPASFREYKVDEAGSHKANPRVFEHWSGRALFALHMTVKTLTKSAGQSPAQWLNMLIQETAWPRPLSTHLDRCVEEWCAAFDCHESGLSRVEDVVDFNRAKGVGHQGISSGEDLKATISGHIHMTQEDVKTCKCAIRPSTASSTSASWEFFKSKGTKLSQSMWRALKSPTIGHSPWT